MTKAELIEKHMASRTAQRELEAAIARYFKPGTPVGYMHGDHWRHGTSVDTSGERVLVRTPTGNEVWVHAYRIYGEQSND